MSLGLDSDRHSGTLVATGRSSVTIRSAATHLQFAMRAARAGASELYNMLHTRLQIIAFIYYQIFEST